MQFFGSGWGRDYGGDVDKGGKRMPEVDIVADEGESTVMKMSYVVVRGDSNDRVISRLSRLIIVNRAMAAL